MKIECHWQDGISTSADALKKFFPDTKIYSCAGHIAQNHVKHLKSLKPIKQHIISKKKKAKSSKKEEAPVMTKSVCVLEIKGTVKIVAALMMHL